MRTSVAQPQTHPSILAWNLANEVAGQGHAGGQAAYIDGMARELHRTDSGPARSRSTSGARTRRTRPALMYRHIDVLGLTNYIGWYDDTYASQARIARIIRANVSRLRRVFPTGHRRDGVRRRGERPQPARARRAATRSRRA